MMRGRSLASLHQVAVLDDGQGDAGDVGLLEGVEPDEMAAHLSGDGHHGHAVHVGVGDGGDQVGGAGAGGGQADAHLARGPGVAVGRVARALLVPDQDVVDVEIVEGVVEGDDLPPGKPNMVSTPSRLSASRITLAAFMAVLRWSRRGAMRVARRPDETGHAGNGWPPAAEGQETVSPPPSTAPVSAPETKAT